MDRRLDRITETVIAIQGQLAAVTRWSDRVDRDFSPLLATQTAQQRAIDDLAARITRLEWLNTVLANVPAGLFAVQRNGSFTRSEGNAASCSPRRRGEPTGRSACFSEILGSVCRGVAGESDESVIETDDSAFRCWYSVLRDEQGEIAGAIGFAQDVAGVLVSAR